MKDPMEATVQKTVSLSEIDPNAFPNCRAHLDPEKVERLSRSIKEQGLLTPLTVTNGGEKYVLISGFNRFEALKRAGIREARVEVRSFDKADPLAPFIDNLTENVARDDLHPADLSRRIGEIVSGAILRGSSEESEDESVEGEEKVERIDKKEFARKIGISVSHFGNLLRADQRLTPEVKAAWRKYDISSHTIFEWTTLEPEEQAEALAEWIVEKEKMKASGRKRKPNAKKGGSGKGESEDDAHARMTTNELRGELARLCEKRDLGKLKGADLAFVRGKVRGLELALGDITLQTFQRTQG